MLMVPNSYLYPLNQKIKKKKKKIEMTQEFPGGPAVRTALLRAWVQSLVGELRSQEAELCSQKKKKKAVQEKKKKMSQVHFPGCSRMWELEGTGGVR